MKALVYTAPEQSEFIVVDDPVEQDDHCIVEVSCCGICGSDMHAWEGHDERRPAPLILGHEVSGTALTGELVGCRVAVNPLVSCGGCEWCVSGLDNLCPKRELISMPPRQGGFAERLVIPVRNLIRVPDHVWDEKAAFTEPMACGWHAVRLACGALGKPIETTRCLVFGGGAIGLGAALVLASKGANEIWLAETNPKRQKTIGKLGDFHVFDPTTDKEPDMVDLVVDGVGVEATRTHACRVIAPGGVIVHIGLGSSSSGMDVRRMTLQEITFIGAYTYSMVDFCDTATALFEGRLGSMDWPEIRPLMEGARAFEDIKAGRVAAPKIILKT